MKRVGITTTIPSEVVYAAGCVPVDLNNIFITSPDPAALVAEAEHAGYPRNACGWIKGIYSTVVSGDFDAIIAVVEGDCSQTQAMVETLQEQGVRVIPFAFPYGRDRDMLKLQIGKLVEALGTTWDESMKWKTRLGAIRRKVWKLDHLTWRTGAIGSFENHYYQVCCSDFNSDPDAFEAEVDSVLLERAQLPVSGKGFPETTLGAQSAVPGQGCPETTIRLGFLGVPPIFTDFYDYMESLGVRVVFNEVQRQFSMPFETDDLVEQYSRYTYPYDVFARIEDINTEVERRGLNGLIHYTQSFCFRQIQDLIIRKHVNVPILTLEGDAPAKLDARSKVRIESFIEMLA